MYTLLLSVVIHAGRWWVSKPGRTADEGARNDRHRFKVTARSISTRVLAGNEKVAAAFRNGGAKTASFKIAG